MSWTCPTCGDVYPDTALAVPKDAAHEERQGCKFCWVSPVGTTRFVRPDAVDPEEVLRS